jgi:hypothetical protein
MEKVHKNDTSRELLFTTPDYPSRHLMDSAIDVFRYILNMYCFTLMFPVHGYISEAKPR